MSHQKKGGIHESNRIFMGPFGWYRLTEASRKISVAQKRNYNPANGGISYSSFFFSLDI